VPAVEVLESRTLPAFLSPAVYPTISSNLDFAAGDFNSDGIPDFAVVGMGGGGNTLGVLLSQPDGTFQSGGTYATGPTSNAVAVGDFNGDGKADLAVTRSNGTVEILLGNGDGTFQIQGDYPVGVNPVTLVTTGDFTGDGLSDLAVLSQSQQSVTVLLSNGDGSFGPGVTYVVGKQPMSVAAADLNGTGIADLAVANTGSGTVSLLRGNGDGTFQSAVDLPLPSAPNWVTAADVNGDGLPDLVTASSAGQEVDLLLNHGDGTFQAPISVATGQLVTRVAVADLNGDGIPDLVTANQGTLNVLLGQGQGTFGPPVLYGVGLYSKGLVVGDFTGDGVPDVATLNEGTTLAIVRSQSDGTFQAALNYPTGQVSNQVVTGDFTGNGILDIVTANNTVLGAGSTVSVLLGNGDGSFQPARSYFANASSEAVAIGDVNGDGIPDLVVANDKTAGTVSVLLGNGDGSFQAPYTYAVGPSPRAVTLADLTGNGILDVITGDQGSGNSTVSVLLGNGDGTFQAASAHNVPYSVAGVAVGDFNGDGIPDLVTANIGSGNAGTLNILLGNGDGTFQTGQSYGVGEKCHVVAVGDLTGNGILDLVTANQFSHTISVLLGNGNGTFHNPVNYEVGGGSNNPWGVALTDVNRDGILDVVASGFLGTVSLFLGNGDGTFQPATLIAKAATEYSIAAADFTGDGYPDLVTTASDGAYVMRNDGDWPTTRAGAPGAAARQAPVQPLMLAAGLPDKPFPMGGAEVEPPLSRLPVSWAPGKPEELGEAVSVPTRDSRSQGETGIAVRVRPPRPPRPVTDLVVLQCPFTNEQGETVFG
jgi:hypothetical protein